MKPKPVLQNPLRTAAETQLTSALSLPARPVKELLHELQVHQIELQMQNEALHNAQVALEESRDRYFDLYEFAPVGYLSLTGEGRISEINLAGALMLGEVRVKLVDSQFASHVLPEDAEHWRQFLRTVLQQHGRLSCELRLTRGHNQHFYARLDCVRPKCKISALRIALTDITERKQTEDERRIAAIAFECQEGILVMDANRKILQVNQAFTRITGYTQQEAEGKTPTILRPNRHPASFYDDVWRDINRTGAWQGDMWQRRKNGEEYPARVTTTVVRNKTGQLTHYVGNVTDVTDSQQQEQQRLLNETAHRNTLVNEVHHRIKNNLQGITGLLRQFVQKHPETADPINQAIGQVQGISVIHGLQGRALSTSVRLCELTGAIADEAQNLWQTPVLLDIPTPWLPCVITNNEAVPIALILNELILNAVKHGGKASGKVNITLQKGTHPDVVQIKIYNMGQLLAHDRQTGAPDSGLQLIAALMPRVGARLIREQHGDQVVTLLEVGPPIISLDLKDAL